jgi:hypothetical protein
VVFEPSEEQRARAQALRRFNRLYLYLPLAVGIVAVLVIVGLLLFGLFSPGITGTAEFMSALADMIIILWSLPLILIMAIVPLAYVGYLANRRQRRRQNPPAPIVAEFGRTRVLLWRLQHLLDRGYVTGEQVAARIAAPLIRFHGLLAEIGAWLAGLNERISTITRSKENEPDGTGV